MHRGTYSECSPPSRDSRRTLFGPHERRSSICAHVRGTAQHAQPLIACVLFQCWRTAAADFADISDGARNRGLPSKSFPPTAPRVYSFVLQRAGQNHSSPGRLGSEGPSLSIPRWNAYPVGRFSTSGTSALGNFPPWSVAIGRPWRGSWVEKKAGRIPVSNGSLPGPLYSSDRPFLDAQLVSSCSQYRLSETSQGHRYPERRRQ